MPVFDELTARTSGESVARRRLRNGLTALVGRPGQSVVEVFPDSFEGEVEAPPPRSPIQLSNRQAATDNVLNMVTGPSGAGKSSFCRDQPDWQYNLHNLDDKVRLTSGSAHLNDAEVRENAWEQMAQAILDDLRGGKTPVTVDHVFDDRALDELVNPARAAGYSVRTWLLATESAGLCVARVRQRGAEGGHGFHPSLVEQMYEDALYAASALSIASDVTYLIDNTGIDGFLPLAQIERFTADVRCEPMPEWAEQRFLAGFFGAGGPRGDADP